MSHRFHRDQTQTNGSRELWTSASAFTAWSLLRRRHRGAKIRANTCAPHRSPADQTVPGTAP